MAPKTRTQSPDPIGQANLERALESASEKIGDITETALAQFYQRAPIARELFSRYQGKQREDLEAAMIEQTLYCIMTWYERPIEVEIILLETVPHHLEALKIPVSTFYSLMDAILDTVASATDKNDQAALNTLDELRRELGAIINSHAV